MTNQKTMNRIIKFRAWDGKEMHLPEYSDKEDFHLLPDGTIVETHEHGVDRHELTGRRGDNWIVMQFTGLTDKSGNDIYEGDIYHQGDTTIKYVVEWIDTGLKGRQVSNKSYAGIEHFRNKIEVIGNIHEHPDLLK